jgi:hypothetical protein
MSRIKKALQNWLGITFVAIRVSEIDMELHPPVEQEEPIVKGYESE